jgi:hypothetical protein
MPAARRARTPARAWWPGRSRQAKLGPDLLGGDVLAGLFENITGGGAVSEVFQEFPDLAGGHALQSRGEPGRDDRGQALPVLGMPVGSGRFSTVCASCGPLAGPDAKPGAVLGRP